MSAAHALVLLVRGVLVPSANDPEWTVQIGILCAELALLIAGLVLRDADGERLEQSGPVLLWGGLAIIALETRTLLLGLILPNLTGLRGLDEGAFHFANGTRTPAFAAFAFGSVVLAPIAEELLVRGALHPRLRRFMSPSAAIGIGSLAFALMHLSRGFFLLGPLATGCVLAWARERTGRLAVPILLHAGINAVPCWLLFIAGSR